MMSYNSTISMIEKKVEYTPEEAGYLPSQIKVLDEHLQKLITRKRLHAAGYIISKDDKVFVHKSMGTLRRNDESSRFLPDTIRRVASVTKLFTAVSILKLVEQGLIRLDQPVAEIIEEFRNSMYEKITVFHLLTHTSGIRPEPGAFREPYPLDSRWQLSQEWIKKVLTDFLAVEIGKEWRYSSAGFAILAEIVSRKSGVQYEKYVMNNIVKPLGMNDTYFDPPLTLSERVSFGDEMEEAWFYDRTLLPEGAAPRGAGGLFSTLEDMWRFGQTLVHKGSLAGVRILSRKTVEAMTRNHTPGIKDYGWGHNGAEMEYGLGMNVYSNNTFLSPGSFAHEGAGLCGLYMDPVENLVLAYSCPLAEGVGWEPEAVINLRNIVWAGIL
jgi:CubicO group peptidase (beta-lactamase class C family)